MPEASPSFGEQVRGLRLGAGLSQAELAEQAGISERAVSDIERGLRSSVYATTARRLADALGVTPEQRSAFLRAASGERRPPASGVAPLAAVPASYRARLPRPLTRLIGRDRDVAALLEQLGDEAARIVTIVGPGGVGKSRLAVEVAARWSAASAADVHFVDLSPVEDPGALLASVAAALGLPVVAADPLPQLSDALATRRSLLLLDTMEHLLDAASAVAQFAAACPRVTVLVTSRSPLRVRGERQWPLAPLALGTPHRATAHSSPAVELFIERARAAVPAFEDGAASRDDVASICARLDGLPLAIELAAARVRLMSVGSLLRGLDDRLSTLTDGSRDAPSRHRTMRAALEWSNALLDDAERSTLRALSVFRGASTADAVHAVRAAESQPTNDVHTSLSGLVDASLVVVEPGVDESRFRLLDVVAAYALELAEVAGERKVLQRAHAEYFLALARRAEPQLRGSGQRAWFARLLADEANLRAAITWALDSGEPEVALQLAAALWMFWRWAGLFADARVWVDAALRLADGGSPDRLTALWGAGWLAFHQGDYARTAEVAAEMLALTVDGGNAVHRRNALTLAGNASLASGDHGDAVERLRTALELCDDTSDVWVRATSLLNLATALAAAGRSDAATPLCEQAVTLYESIGDRHFAARAHLQLAYEHILRGEMTGATQHAATAIAIIGDLGDMWGVAEGLEAVAALRAEDRPRDSATLAGAAARVRELIGMLPHPPDARVNAGRLQRARELVGDVAFRVAWNEGRDAPLQSMLDLAAAMTH